MVHIHYDDSFPIVFAVILTGFKALFECHNELEVCQEGSLAAAADLIFACLSAHGRHLCSSAPDRLASYSDIN